eukprot:2507189-Heterocapsa_arctica.AAC.1
MHNKPYCLNTCNHGRKTCVQLFALCAKPPLCTIAAPRMTIALHNIACSDNMVRCGGHPSPAKVKQPVSLQGSPSHGGMWSLGRPPSAWTRPIS